MRIDSSEQCSKHLQYGIGETLKKLKLLFKRPLASIDSRQIILIGRPQRSGRKSSNADRYRFISYNDKPFANGHTIQFAQPIDVSIAQWNVNQI
jgi:hypothetical protein